MTDERGNRVLDAAGDLLVTFGYRKVTVADVAARLQADEAIRGRSRQEVMAAMQNLRQVTTPLPDNLSQRGVRQLFERLGLTVSERVQDVFREAAIFLAMGRRQNMARLAATRRQRQKPPKPSDEEKSP